MAGRFTLSDVINVEGDGNCFFHALKEGLNNIFSSYIQLDTIIGVIDHKTLRQNIVEGLLKKIDVSIEEFKKITIQNHGKKGEAWLLASYHGLDTNASNDDYELAQKQLIAHLERMKANKIFATDLEVFGAQLYFQELMNSVRRKKPEFAKLKLGEIKIGVYTPPRNEPPFLQGNEDVRKDNDAVIRIINESGYTVNGWHFDALPSTDFDGNITPPLVEPIANNQNKPNYDLETANLHFEYLKKEMSKVSEEITEYNNINNGNYQTDYKEAVNVVIGKLIENKQILINELINLYIETSNIDEIDEQFSNTMRSYLHDQLDNSERNITTRVDINFNDIKAGIGLELELNLPLFAELGITKYCCQTGGGMKKKHKRKKTKRTKGKKEKKGRKWSKKYKDSINLSLIHI